ncbi:MAG: CpsD/CapB family tyrosine-protein kinase [candidate division Zixibacteria bacterium]|nr:CpsD/CapB family tyrosine-protein kinase [candidate division Zixibacteria bacterium]
MTEISKIAKESKKVKKLKKTKNIKKKKTISVQDIFNSESPECAEFRRVLHNLDKSKKGGDKQVVLITSATLSEGKSLTSSFLAMTSASYKNNKTLLIDFDLRRPTIHRLFGVERTGGISDIILDGLAPQKTVKSTNIDKLDLLTAGKFVDTTSELIKGPNVHRIIEEMKFYYDTIIVDSPPLVPVMDTVIFIEEFDAILLVVKAGGTKRELVSRARNLLANNSGKLVGVIMNNMKNSLPYHYNHNYYSQNYKSSEK